MTTPSARIGAVIDGPWEVSLSTVVRGEGVIDRRVVSLSTPLAPGVMPADETLASALAILAERAPYSIEGLGFALPDPPAGGPSERCAGMPVVGVQDLGAARARGEAMAGIAAGEPDQLHLGVAIAAWGAVSEGRWLGRVGGWPLALDHGPAGRWRRIDEALDDQAAVQIARHTVGDYARRFDLWQRRDLLDLFERARTARDPGPAVLRGLALRVATAIAGLHSVLDARLVVLHVPEPDAWAMVEALVRAELRALAYGPVDAARTTLLRARLDPRDAAAIGAAWPEIAADWSSGAGAGGSSAPPAPPPIG